MRLPTTVLMALILLAGCNTQAQWTYPIQPEHLYREAQAERKFTVAVLPFRESRPVTNRSATFFLYLIPLMPFGWMSYERPEAARMFNTIAEFDMEMDEDLGKAAVRSLEESGLFRRVYFTLGGETEEADLILRGTVKRMRYNGRIISYGLSVYGPLLWVLGLPAGTSANTLQLSLSLQTPDSHEFWTYDFEDRESIVQGLYYNWGNDALNFAILMQEGMNHALQNLASHLPEMERQLGSPLQ